MKGKAVSGLILALLLIGILPLSFRIQLVEASETTIFEDDFEGYSVGTFPSAGGWELWTSGAGSGQQVIVESFSNSPTKSLKLLGQYNWGAIAALPYSTTQPYLTYEICVRINELATQHTIARVGFVDWYSYPTTVRFFSSVAFMFDGTIRLAGYGELQTFVPGEWYKVKQVTNRVNDVSSVWINDVLKASNVPVTDSGPPRPDIHFTDTTAFALTSFWAGVEAYFDDFRLSEKSEASSDWWDHSWGYRKSHVIQNAAGAGTNYQVKIRTEYGIGVDSGDTVYLNNRAQVDFDDVRFLDDDQSTELDYWLEEKVDGSSAVFWVEVQDDLDTYDATIYVYYGNPSASSLSNGANTFIDFDDYEYADSLENHGWNITNIAPGGSLAPQTAVASHGSYALKSYDPDYYGYPGNGWKRYPACPARVLWHWKVRKEQTAGLYSCVWFDAKEGGNQFGQIQWQHLTNNVRARTESGSWVNFATYMPGQWHEVEVVVNTDTDKYESIWWDGNLKATNILAYQASGNIVHLHHNHAGSIGSGTAYEDFFYARKYVDPEPQHGSWGTTEGYDRAITVLSPQNKTYATISIPLTFTVNETASWMGYSLEGQANVTITGNTTLTNLLEGSHNVVVYANNTAGTMWASATVYFTVDTTPPTVSVLFPENTAYAAAGVPLTFTMNEPTSWIGYSLDDQTNVTISGNTTLTDLTEGSHSVVVYANDTSGNMGASSEVSFTIALPPVISILSPENMSYAVNDIPLTFVVDVPADWISYSLDGQANATITGNTTLTSLGERTHGVVVYANDTDGDMGSSTVYFTVDLTPPTVSVLSPENTTYAAAGVALTFTVNEATSWIGYSLDDQANVTISGNTALNIQTNGSHNVIVYAKDMAGNTAASNRVFFTTELPVSGSCTISIEPSKTVVAAGQTVTATITITNINDCAGYQLYIDYNPAVLEYVGYTFDTDPANPLSPTQIAPSASQRVEVDVSVPGSVKLATVWKAATPTYSGNGVAAEITFQALAAGNSTLVFDQSWTRAIDHDANDILFEEFNDNFIAVVVATQSISVDSSTEIVQSDQTVTFTVNITDITDCAGYQFKIDYNPAILSFDSWTFDTGTPLTPSQIAPAAAQRLDTDLSVPGSVRLATVWKAGVPTYSGNGVAAEVTFQTIAAGNCTLVFDQLWTIGVNFVGQEIVFGGFDDGWVVVTVQGDVDSDHDVDVADQRKVQLAMFSTYPDPLYVQYNTYPIFTDVDGDGDVDVGDQRKQQLNMFQSW